jgi:hypothetical protein
MTPDKVASEKIENLKQKALERDARIKAAEEQYRQPNRSWLAELMFDSVHDWLTAAEPDEDVGMASAQRVSQGIMFGRDWYGTATYEEAVKLARYGWESGLNQVLSLKEEIDRKVAEYVPKLSVTHDVAGDMVDIDRMMQGDPEHMMEWQIRPIYTRVINITVDCAVSASVSSKVIKARGAVIGSLIDAFERMRVPTSVTVAWRSAGSGGTGTPSTFSVGIEAKRPGETLDLDKLMFLVAHPSASRRIIFSHKENLPAAMRKAHGVREHGDGGYGTPINTPKHRQGDIHFGAMRGDSDQWTNPQKAVMYVLAQLEKAGIDLEE